MARTRPSVFCKFYDEEATKIFKMLFLNQGSSKGRPPGLRALAQNIEDSDLGLVVLLCTRKSGLMMLKGAQNN